MTDTSLVTKYLSRAQQKLSQLSLLDRQITDTSDTMGSARGSLNTSSSGGGIGESSFLDKRNNNNNSKLENLNCVDLLHHGLSYYEENEKIMSAVSQRSISISLSLSLHLPLSLSLCVCGCVYIHHCVGGIGQMRMDAYTIYAMVIDRTYKHT